MDGKTIETMLAAQGIALAAGRGDKLAPGVNAQNVADPLRGKVPFEVDPTSYTLARERLK